MTVPTYLLALSLLTATVPSPRTPITPASTAPAPSVRSRAETRHAHRLTTSGSAVLITGCAAWGVMIGGMALGSIERRQYNEIVAEINAAERPPSPSDRDRLAAHNRHGSSDNTIAITGAIVGTALTILGAALLGRGVVLRKRQGRLAPLRVAASWRPTF